MRIIRKGMLFLIITVIIAGLLPCAALAEEYTAADLYPEEVMNWSEETKTHQREATKIQYDNILKAIADGKDGYTLPKGDYRVYNDYVGKFILRDAENFVLDFSDSTLWVEGWSTALEIYSCKNLTVKNLKIDYDPLPYIQGTITAVDKENSTVDLLLDNGSAYPDESWCAHDGSMMKFILFGSDGNMLASRMNWTADKGYTIIDDNHIRVKHKSDYTFKDKGSEQVVPGIKAVIPWRRGEGAIVLDYSDYCVLEKIDMYTSQGMGIRPHYGKGGHLFKECRFIPRPDTGRLLSTNADSWHGYMMENAGTIDGCVFEHQADDGINANAFMHFVYEIIDETHLFIATYYGEVLKAGEELNFIDLENGKRLGTAVINKITTVDDSLLVNNVMQIPTAIAAELGIRNRGPYLNCAMYYVELDTPVTVKHFDFVCPKYENSQFTVKNSRFYDSVAHGILSKISNTTIENCYFGRNSEGAVKIESNRYWFEGSTDITNVKIKNNTFESNSKNYFSNEEEIIININFSNTDYTHIKGVEITGNKFINPNSSILLAKNMEDFKFNNNTVEWNDNRIVKKYNDFDTLMEIGVSKNVDISGNELVNKPDYITNIADIAGSAQNVTE